MVAHAALVTTFRAWLATPAGCVYLARRVRVGARAVVAEALRLEAWLATRAPFNHTH